MSTMRLPVRGRRGRRQSPPELVFGFSPEGRRREEAFYRSLDGNAEIEDLLERGRLAEEQELLERDRLADEQRISDLRRQRDMEQQHTDALIREQSARTWADYVEAGARQIALEAVGHAHVRGADFYHQLIKWLSRLEVKASVDHAGMERANAPYRTSGKSEARRRTPVPAFSMYRRWRPTF